MRRYYNIADCLFSVEGEDLSAAVTSLPGFSVFETEEGDLLFNVCETAPEDAPEADRLLFDLFHDGCRMWFSTCAGGHVLVMEKGSECMKLWRCSAGLVNVAGCLDPQMLKFAMWIGFGLETVARKRIAMHCSCIVKDSRAYLFLGESGTGKSTHTRLWRENIEGAFLLNDDSPVLAVEDGDIWIYGSPWSGKTPCYRRERYRLGGCVRLSQAPFNEIVRLPLLKAFASIHPSCPPQFAGDDSLYDWISATLGEVLKKTAVWHLRCLPDPEAARLSYETITKQDNHEN